MTENSRLEFKSILNEKLEKEIVAFLNSDGGILYIGIDDDGLPIEKTDVDDVQLRASSRILQTNIMPSTMGLFDVIIEEVAGIPVVKILVSSGPEKPYYIKAKGICPAGCFYRVGSQTLMMTGKMIENLYERRVRNSLRNMLSPRQDLTFADLEIYYRNAGLTLNESFERNLEFFTPEGKYNYLAYLLADVNNVSIKVAKYAGTDKVDLIRNEEFGYCSLIKATKSVLDKLDIYNETSCRITYPLREERKLIERTPMREAAINAILHNDYCREVPPVFEMFSNRLEITSYGGLMPGFSEEDFFNCCSLPRNRELMRVFKDLKMVEQLGSGMGRILQAYDESIFKISENYLRVVFPFAEPIDDIEDNSKNAGAPEESQIEAILIELIKKKPEISKNEMSSKLGVSERQVDRIIKKMRSAGKLERHGTKGGHWIVKEKK